MQQSVNIIRLDGSLSSSLEWQNPGEAPDFWYLDFGWEKTPFAPFNTAHLSSYQLAVQELGPKLPAGSKVILAKVAASFGSLFASSERLEMGYHEFLEHQGLLPHPRFFELYAAHLLSDYLHRLAALLPEETTPYLEVELSLDDSFADQVLLLCRRRFAHFQFRFSHAPLPSGGKIGISLPADRLFQPTLYAPLFSLLTERGVAFHALPEERLNDHWDGIDHLIIDPETMSETGKRMLHGFEAAGGEIVTMGREIGGFAATPLALFLKKSE